MYDTAPSVSPVESSPGSRPIPRPSAATKPFWDACAEGRLLYQGCRECDAVWFPPQGFCPNDLSADVEWRESAGRGSLYSWTRVWRAQTPAFEVPYVVGIVELDEDYTMLSNIVGADYDLRTGCRLRVRYVPYGAGIVAPCFEPV